MYVYTYNYIYTHTNIYVRINMPADLQQGDDNRGHECMCIHTMYIYTIYIYTIYICTYIFVSEPAAGR
jgi:hypothetical protein